MATKPQVVITSDLQPPPQQLLLEQAGMRVASSTSFATTPSSNGARTRDRAVFSASYTPLLWILLVIVPLSIIPGVIVVIFVDDDSTPQDVQTAKMVFWVDVAFMAVLFGLFLPKEYEVSKQKEKDPPSASQMTSVAVVTLLHFKWHFKNVTRCYEGEDGSKKVSCCCCWSSRHSIWHLFTDHANHVTLIRRRSKGEWDVVLSPKDPIAFMDAIRARTTFGSAPTTSFGERFTPSMDEVFPHASSSPAPAPSPREHVMMA